MSVQFNSALTALLNVRIAVGFFGADLGARALVDFVVDLAVLVARFVLVVAVVRPLVAALAAAFLFVLVELMGAFYQNAQLRSNKMSQVIAIKGLAL